MYCMGVGFNGQDQLGIRSAVYVRVPTAVFSPTGVTAWTQVSAGERHTCGITSNGSVMCWGAYQEHEGLRFLRGSLSHSTHVAGVV